VNKAAAWYLRGIDYTPAFVSVEPLNHSGHGTRSLGGHLRHGLIVPYDLPRRPDRRPARFLTNFAPNSTYMP
jgi:hypothetical protein